MSSERILICGAGVSGSVLAFWLAKHNYQVTVIERSRADQKLGQGIEIEEPALSVVKAMGILPKLEEKQTAERGFELHDEKARTYGRLEIGGFSPTGALELMRGDLVEVLYRAADAAPNVTYRFETTIRSLSQTSSKVTVDLENRTTKVTTTEEFDLVVGADGVKSRTRHLAMGSLESLRCYHRVGAFNAYFSIPREEGDWPYSKLCHFPGRRAMWLRPTSEDSNMTTVYLIHLNDGNDVPGLRAANASGDRAKQKQAFADIYRGLGWETTRVVEQMMTAENFYSDELEQVKLSTWSTGRVALVGDAAWAPTPFTGEGNQLAIIGAWVLAQELSRNRGTIAFEKYEDRLRRYVENCQSIPIGGYAPYFCVPRTSLGIWLFRTIYRAFVAFVIPFLKWWNRSSDSSDKNHEPFDLEMEEEESRAEAPR